MKRYTVLFLLYVMGILSASAQIGYQVALLNQADGTPRANETVKVDVAITNSEGHEICREEKSATTDEFGILSLTIGNSTTFETVDFTNLPFYISATVDGVLIGKSQMLNVPVAEYAKRTGVLTCEFLNGTRWVYSRYSRKGTYSFDNQHCILDYYDDESGYHGHRVYDYEIVGNHVILYTSDSYKFDNGGFEVFIYIPSLNAFADTIEYGYIHLNITQ